MKREYELGFVCTPPMVSVRAQKYKQVHKNKAYSH